MSSAKILELGFKGFLTIIPLILAVNFCSGQEITSEKLIEFKFGFQAPLADMETRFGGSNVIGFGLQNANLHSTFLYGIDGFFIFGNTVKEDVLQNLRSFDGNIVGIDGHPADVNLKERGFYFGLNAGKIFKITKEKNNLTGIRTQIGVGLLQHKIRVQENSNTIVALNKEYLNEFDRLSNGPSIHLAAGFQYDNPKNNFHFNIMGNLIGATTKSRRDYDHVTGGYIDTKRTDIQAGLSLSYIVSISRSEKADNIYY